MKNTILIAFAVILLSGCVGINPYEPRNHRLDGPPQGLFTGPTGEYVIKPEFRTPPSTPQPEQTPIGKGSAENDLRQ